MAVDDWPSDDGASLNIRFNASADDTAADPEVTRYDVHRAPTAAGAGARIGQVNASRAAAYAYRDTGLVPGKTYWYWVIAVGATAAVAAISAEPAISGSGTR